MDSTWEDPESGSVYHTETGAEATQFVKVFIFVLIFGPQGPYFHLGE